MGFIFSLFKKLEDKRIAMVKKKKKKKEKNSK